MKKAASKFDHWTGFAVVASFGLVSLILPTVTQWCFHHLSQPLVMLLLLTTVAHIARRPISWSAFRYAALAGAIGVLLVTLSVETGFRVLSDEANLVGISRSLLFDGEPAIPLQSRWSFDRFWTIETQVPKRPLLYPFLVSWVHRVAGYRIENAFATNLGVLFLFIAGSFYLATRWWGLFAGLAAATFLLAQPIVSLTATSAGYDLLAAFLFATTLIFGARYFKTPTRRTLVDWVICLMWLIHVRYESLLLLPIAAVCVWKTKGFRKEWVAKSWAWLILCPLLVLPRLWQHALTWGEEGQFAPVGLQYAWENIKVLFHGFFVGTPTLPYAQWLGWAALAGLATALCRRESRALLKHHIRKPYVWAPLCLFAVDQIVRLLVSGVSYVDPNTFRLYLFLQVALGGLLLYSLIALRAPRPAIFLLGLFFWGTYHPIAMENRAYRSMDSIFETKLTYQFLDRYRNQRVMLITDRPGNYTIREVGAVDFEYANKNLKLLVQELSDQLYDDVFIIQRIPYSARDQTRTHLSENVLLEPTLEHQTTLNHFLRISRLVYQAPETESPQNLTQTQTQTEETKKNDS